MCGPAASARIPFGVQCTGCVGVMAMGAHSRLSAARPAVCAEGATCRVSATAT